MAKTNDNDLKDYLENEQGASQPKEEQKEELNEDEVIDDPESPEQSQSEESANHKRTTRVIKKLHFWSDWSRKKKIYVFGGGLLASLVILILSLIFIIQPSKANSYVSKSWHDLVVSSASIDRAVKSEVNLEGTRDLTKELYAYNEKLNATSFDSKSKSSITYKSSTTNEYADLTDQMGDYFSDSATTLAKTDSDITSISEDELGSLRTKGSELKTKVDDFRTKKNLQEEINANLFNLDTYISEVKSKKEEIEKEKKDEEQKKKDEEAAAKAKDSADKASVESVGNSYFKAYINGSEAGVRATLSKGYQGEYDFASLTPARRTSFYPKSHRIVTVVKDGENYKLTASVTYVSVYQDSGGNNVESIQPITEIYRVVYSTDAGSWKIDGRVES